MTNTKPSRRALAKGTAWTLPALVLTAAATPIAASGEPDPCGEYANGEITISQGPDSAPRLVGTYNPSGVAGACASQSFYDATTISVKNTGSVNFTNTSNLLVYVSRPPSVDWNRSAYPVGFKITGVLVDGVPVDPSTWWYNSPPTTTGYEVRVWFELPPILVGEERIVTIQTAITNYSGVNGGTRPLLNEYVSGTNFRLGYLAQWGSDPGDPNGCLTAQSGLSFQSFTSTPGICP